MADKEQKSKSYRLQLTLKPHVTIHLVNIKNKRGGTYTGIIRDAIRLMDNIQSNMEPGSKLTIEHPDGSKVRLVSLW